MSEQAGAFKRAYRVVRWFALVALVTVLALMLKQPKRPPMQPAPALQENAQTFEQKLHEMEQARERGETIETHFTSAEVDAIVVTSTESEAAAAAVKQATEQADSGSPEAAQQVTIAPGSTRVEFRGDEMVGYLTANLYGKDVYVTVAGRLGVREGYAEFQPTQFKVGDMTIPVALVEGPLRQRLAEPEMRDKLKLPEFVGDLRVENGELIVVQR